jgi:hypothetical protein
METTTAISGKLLNSHVDAMHAASWHLNEEVRADIEHVHSHRFLELPGKSICEFACCNGKQK